MSYLEELLPEFRKGAKIRQNDWDKDVFIYFYNDQIYWKDSGHWKDGKIASTKDLVSIFTLHDNNWELYQEPIDFDYIIKNKCLCYFWDEWFGAACIGILGRIYEELDLKYVLRDENGNQIQYRNCRPVRRDEITFYEDRK